MKLKNMQRVAVPKKNTFDIDRNFFSVCSFWLVGWGVCTRVWCLQAMSSDRWLLLDQRSRKSLYMSMPSRWVRVGVGHFQQLSWILFLPPLRPEWTLACGGSMTHFLCLIWLYALSSSILEFHCQCLSLLSYLSLSIPPTVSRYNLLTEHSTTLGFFIGVLFLVFAPFLSPPLFQEVSHLFSGTRPWTRKERMTTAKWLVCVMSGWPINHNDNVELEGGRGQRKEDPAPFFLFTQLT